MTITPRGTGLDRETVAETTTRVLGEMVRRDAGSLSADTRLFLDLGLTSSNALELVMRLEDELGIELKAGALDWRHLETVGALTAYAVRQAGV